MSLHYDSIEQLPEHLRKQAKEKLGIVATVEQVYCNQVAPKQNKYHVSSAPDRTYKGVVYDSKREMLYYINELEPKLKSRELTYVIPHVCFPLGAGVKYECDFMCLKAHWTSGPPLVRHHSWEIVIIEVKMWRKATAKHPAGFFFTPDAKIKMKLFKNLYPAFRLEIVR
jgi:hypothetical protein